MLERTSLSHGRGATQEPATFIKTVYGYLPYWNDEVDVAWESLTHLSYFSVELNSTGSLGTSHGWSTNGADLVAVGHSFGVQVTLTATLFDDDGIATLLGNASYRDAAISNLLAMVQAQGGDGVNIDFEFVPASRKVEFVTFMTDLTNAFHTAIPGSHVSLATPAVDWNSAYDYDLLAENTDGMMIMGYGYHWSSGNPGPISPVSAGTTWNSRSLSWTIADYIEWGGAQNRDKFVLGIPLYGRQWQSVDASVPGEREAGTTGSSVILTNCETSFASGKSWDEDSQTPYRVHSSSGEWRQLFCEDDASFAAKFDLILSEDIGGVMYWAVGYTPAVHSVWDLNDSYFTLPPVVNTPPVASASAPSTGYVGEAVWLDGTTSYDPDGETLVYAWSVVEGPTVAIQDADEALAVVYPEISAAYRFRLEVSDAQDSASTELEVSVLSGSGGSGGSGGVGGDGGTGGSGGTGGTGETGGSGGQNFQGESGSGGLGGSQGEITGGCAVIPARWTAVFLLLGMLLRRARG